MMQSYRKQGVSQIKFIVGLILIVLVLIFMFQNLEVVRLTFLFWEVNLSEAGLIIIMLLIGMAIGWALTGAIRRRRAVTHQSRTESMRR